MQVIIYNNPNGNNVCVCYPSEELEIEEVLSKDCPEGSIIVDYETLPEDHTYFNAWRLIDDSIIVELEASKEIAICNLNAWAKQEFINRSANESIGITDGNLKEDGDDFATVIQNGRDFINQATEVDQLTSIVENTIDEAKYAPLNK